MNYTGGKQPPPSARVRHSHRLAHQGYQHDKIECVPAGPPDGRGAVTQPGRYMPAQQRGYGPPPGSDNQPQPTYHPAMQYQPHYQQAVHEMVKPGLELGHSSMPGGVYPGQHQPAPTLLRPAVGSLGYGPPRGGGPQMMGPRPPVPAPYPAHPMSLPGMSMPPPGVQGVPFTMQGAPPPAPPGHMMLVQGLAPDGTAGPVARPQYGVQGSYQQPQFTLLPQPPQGPYAPQAMWQPVALPQQQMHSLQQLDQRQMVQPTQPSSSQHQQQHMQQQHQLQQQQLQPQHLQPQHVQPQHVPQQHHVQQQQQQHQHQSHRIPIIDPATGRDLFSGSPSAQSASQEPVWRPPGAAHLGNGVAGGRGYRQHSSASASEPADCARLSRPRSSASLSDPFTAELAAPDWPGRAGRYATANGRASHSPDVIRREVIRHASPSAAYRQEYQEVPPGAGRRAGNGEPAGPPRHLQSPYYPNADAVVEPVAPQPEVDHAALADLAPPPSLSAPVVAVSPLVVTGQLSPASAAAELSPPADGSSLEPVPDSVGGPATAAKAMATDGYIEEEEPTADALEPYDTAAIVQERSAEDPAAAAPQTEPVCPGPVTDSAAVAAAETEPAAAAGAELEPQGAVAPDVVGGERAEPPAAAGAGPDPAAETAEDAAPSLPVCPDQEPAVEEPGPVAECGGEPAGPTQDDGLPEGPAEADAAPMLAATDAAATPLESAAGLTPAESLEPVPAQTPVTEPDPVPAQTLAEEVDSVPDGAVTEEMESAASPVGPGPVTEAGGPEQPGPTLARTPADELVTIAEKQESAPDETAEEPEPEPAQTPAEEPESEPAAGAGRPGAEPTGRRPGAAASPEPAAAVNGAPERDEAPAGGERPHPPEGTKDPASGFGKTQYGRDELLRLQHHPLSQRRPAALPDLPSVVRRDRSGGISVEPRPGLAPFKSRSAGGGGGPVEFASGFKPAMGPLPGKYRGRSSGQVRRDSPMQGPPPPRRIEISLNRDIKLSTTEKPWKPGAAAAEKADAEVLVIKSLKGILNKITPSNIDRQIENIKKLEMNVEERLANMIKVLFDKAVDEPAYASQYAAVCVAMAKTEVDGEGNKKITFRKLLLTQCQREFEKDKSLELNREDRQREIEAQTDPAVKREKARALEEEERKVRLRSNGNIRFIGELYKLGMLTDRIMQQCVSKLLKDRHEDSYECLCKLVTTIGQKLETAENARGKNLDPYFDQFRRLAGDRSLSSRVRFMLQDLMELRSNHWVNTRAAGQPRPMKIEEVHQQARQQAAEQQVALAQAEDRRRGDRRRAGAGPARNQFDPGRVMNWVNSYGGPPAAQPKLGPGGGAGAWSMGSKVGPPRGAGGGGGGATLVSNRFQALRGEERAPTPSQSANGPGGAERADAVRPAAAGPPSAAARLTGPADATADDMQRQARAIVGEFVENGDVEASMEDCETHLHENTMATFVAQCLDVFVDAKSVWQRHAAGQLHRLLLERGLLSLAAYLEGAGQMLDVAVDLAVDVPAVWTNLAQLLAPPLLARPGAVPLARLGAAAAGCGGSGGRLLVALLRRVQELAGTDRLRALAPPDTNWALFFGSDDHERRLMEADLDFLLSTAGAPLPTERAPEANGLRALLGAIRADGELALWLERNCTAEHRQHPQFFGDLMAAVCFDAIVIDDDVPRALPYRLERYADLLRTELDNPDREVAALVGVQDLVRHLDFPQGLLEQLFRLLLELDVLPEAAFRRWRESTESAGLEGKGAAALSLAAFFQELDAAAEEEARA